MKIYFAASIRAGRDDALIYSELAAHIKKYGAILSEHVADPNLEKTGDDELPERHIHDRDLSWIKESDVLIAEITQPSLGVGYEIAHALHYGKPVLCLYRPQAGKKPSAMIKGSPKIIFREYANKEEANKAIDEFFLSQKN